MNERDKLYLEMQATVIKECLRRENVQPADVIGGMLSALDLKEARLLTEIADIQIEREALDALQHQMQKQARIGNVTEKDRERLAKTLRSVVVETGRKAS